MSAAPVGEWVWQGHLTGRTPQFYLAWSVGKAVQLDFW